MSRRPPPSADRAEANRSTLKQLVKLESNKSCADCKRNKHPRWASWNLGVFVCIRCSGIHRGMGTHISRVKSVDLDSWTDEQMQSMLRWGNARANKYWEHKLAEGHVPNESKIENFIRTKYDSKRWVIDGPMPDPATLDDGGEEDDVPLNLVREKAIGDRGRGARNGSGSIPPPATRTRPQDVDLFGDPGPTPARPSTTEPAVQRGVQKAAAAPPKQTKPGESLLGLDFFGGAQSAAPARPSSTGASTAGVPGRADLKSSILSLYASKPAAPPAQQQPQQQNQSNMGMLGGMQPTTMTSPTQQNASGFGGMNDAFSSLSFSSQPQSQQKSTPFSNFSPPSGHNRQPSATKSSLSGGSFFDAKPASDVKTTSTPAQTFASSATKDSFGGDFGDFSSATSPVAAKSPPAATSSMGDLFDISGTMSPPLPPKPTTTSQPTPVQAQQFQTQPSYSAFNLSQPKPAPQQSPPQAQTSTLTNFASMNNTDAWGSNDAWATPDPAPAEQPAPANTSFANFSKPIAAPTQTAFDSGWGDVASPVKPAAPTASSAGGFSVQQDEEFGGWSHASPIAQTPGGVKPGGGALGGSDNPFDNPWG